MEVTVTNTTQSRVDSALIKQAALETLKVCKSKGNISVVIIGDQRMRTLNRVYRGKDSVTDVLSFTEAEASLSEPNFLGEIFIDLGVIKKQAKKFAPSFRFELAFIAIHGTLHLLGYEDKTKVGAHTMETLGHTIIKKVL
ncbi:MAG TPA: rRNA maturation RNase YbeY [bacterium]|jgi:probable rRNA maturation factor|nr:rRNA maturation RNase YbeY [bacterium]